MREIFVRASRAAVYQNGLQTTTLNPRYKRVIERFTGFLGEAKSKRDLSTLQASDVARFRRARNRRARERRSFAPIHASNYGRQARRHATLAGRDEGLRPWRAVI